MPGISAKQAAGTRHAELPSAGAQRVIIEQVSPEVDGGRFPIKRVVGEEVLVTAVIFADGHDVLSAVLKHRGPGQDQWTETRLLFKGNDRWIGAFKVLAVGAYEYTVEAWVNHFGSWRRDLEKRFAAGQELTVDLLGGLPHLRYAAEHAGETDREKLLTAAEALTSDSMPTAEKVALATEPHLAELVEALNGRPNASGYPKVLRAQVDPELAGFSSWYELFPRSCGQPGTHGTLRDCEAQLERISRMGFDVVYLPPIHPIGRSFRKGRNNSLHPQPGDPGSPWAIGGREGGHKSVHPELGTLEDFQQFVRTAESLKLKVALDIAFQCSPDHPYVREHPEWFRKRPDGSIQYAENPPKKYQDIYPLNFESENWQALWKELKSVFEFWIEQGVTVFRVDNPHTKSFRFWEWCIAELKAKRPELIFLSEAFTRPSVMYYLAKLGFNQSYNYFPWRNTAFELKEFFMELTRTNVKEFFRPNLWPNTPDILPEYLQYGGRPAFMIRLILAATLGASYGIYGPPYEVCENIPREPGSEEYLNSEKYEIRHWDLSAPGSLGELMTRINQLRRANPALRQNDTLRFHEVDNPELLAYSKSSPDGTNLVLAIVNLDPHHTQSGWVSLNLPDADLPIKGGLQAHDLLTDARYLWHHGHNFVQLNPHLVPAHILKLRRYLRTEHDFDYFL